MGKIRLFEAFAGYGSQAMAMERLGIPFESVGISEIDKYAIQAYRAVHGDTKNFGDISKVDWSEVPDFDLFTYSFPCQDISTAGYQKGLEKGSGTRSSLLWECQRAIEAKMPKYLLMENVKALTQKKFLPYLNEWQNYLNGLGYSNFTKVLNAKDFGVPQNRERVFMVSILGLDEMYHFPEPFKLTTRLKDVLEQNVDEKYYLSKKMLEYFEGIDKISECTDKLPKAIGYSRDAKGNVVNRFLKNITNTIKSTGKGGNQDVYIAEPQIIQIGNFMPDRKYNNCQRGRLYSTNGISPCLASACGEGGNITPKIIQVGNIDKRKDGFSNPQRGRVYSDEGISPTIDTMERGNAEPKIVDTYRIRKLTPRECFRLMGVSDTDIDKIQAAGISNSQQYKMAGNSIVVDVLYHIFRKMFVDKKNESRQLSLFD